MIDIPALNARMCEIALERLETMGEEGGGLFNYYSHLARRGTMLRAEEIAVAEYIDRTVIKGTPIMELCAGAAQLSHLLDRMDHPTYAVEIDKRRHAFAVALGKRLGSCCNVILDSWQNIELSKYGLLVTLNAATTHIFPDDSRWLIEYAKGGGEFIIRPRQFGKAGIPVEIPGLQSTKVFEDVYHYRCL
jgi:hypothetical protein